MGGDDGNEKLDDMILSQPLFTTTLHNYISHIGMACIFIHVYFIHDLSMCCHCQHIWPLRTLTLAMLVPLTAETCWCHWQHIPCYVDYSIYTNGTVTVIDSMWPIVMYTPQSIWLTLYWPAGLRAARYCCGGGGEGGGEFRGRCSDTVSCIKL